MLRSLSPPRGFFGCRTTTGGSSLRSGAGGGHPRLWSFAPPVLFPGHQYIRIGNQPRFPSPPRGGARGGVCYSLNAINLSASLPARGGSISCRNKPLPLGEDGRGLYPFKRRGEEASIPSRSGPKPSRLRTTIVQQQKRLHLNMWGTAVYYRLLCYVRWLTPREWGGTSGLYSATRSEASGQPRPYGASKRAWPDSRDCRDARPHGRGR